jgi:hypothetical protein
MAARKGGLLLVFVFVIEPVLSPLRFLALF